jgi:hypothetical protein
MARGILLAFVLLLLSLSGCGGDMTAEKLEERLAEDQGGLGLTKVESVECHEGLAWHFECTSVLTQGVISTISNEMVMGFMFDGDDVECGTGPIPAASGLPSPGEICPQLAR